MRWVRDSSSASSLMHEHITVFINGLAVVGLGEARTVRCLW
jgi:hypothetical protein